LPNVRRFMSEPDAGWCRHSDLWSQWHAGIGRNAVLTGAAIETLV
jgi:hypothetical protein